MKLFLYILAGLSVNGLAFWMISTYKGPQNPLIDLLVIAVFILPAVGCFWMLYKAVRHEKHPLSMVLMAVFLPYSFLWYYFERVKPGMPDAETSLIHK